MLESLERIVAPKRLTYMKMSVGRNDHLPFRLAAGWRVAT